MNNTIISTTTQQYTSAKTSINSKRLPAIYNKIRWECFKGGVVLDIGAGKYTEHIKDFLAQYNIEYIPYDPYNLSAADNLYASSNFHRATCVICSNVFNVIKETKIIYDLHSMITSYGVPYFITVYEGDRSWIGRETKKGCWQRNETMESYILNYRETVINKVITHQDNCIYIKRWRAN